MTAELAVTPEQITTGMMFRTNLEENAGMLFLLGRPVQPSFWMKNCPLPLSAAYIDPAGIILELHDFQPQDTNPVVATARNVQYVLETSRGWFEQHHIRSGMLGSHRVREFSRNLHHQARLCPIKLAPKTMKIALAQINPTIGDFAGNEAKILQAARRAEAEHLDLVLFPELTHPGLPAARSVAEKGFHRPKPGGAPAPGRRQRQDRHHRRLRGGEQDFDRPRPRPMKPPCCKAEKLWRRG